MTKILCDRCKNEIKNPKLRHEFEFQGSSDSWDGELCDDCYKAFVSFMNMEDCLYHTNPPSNHGIERMTFGSR